MKPFALRDPQDAGPLSPVSEGRAAQTGVENVHLLGKRGETLKVNASISLTLNGGEC